MDEVEHPWYDDSYRRLTLDCLDCFVAGSWHMTGNITVGFLSTSPSLLLTGSDEDSPMEVRREYVGRRSQRHQRDIRTPSRDYWNA